MATRIETARMTMAQAVVKFLSQQYVERDGIEQPFIAGVWGIFGHGNVAGIGQALEELKLEMEFHRPQRDQHDHRRGHGDDQSSPGAAPAGRHLRFAPPRSSVATARVSAEYG